MNTMIKLLALGLISSLYITACGSGSKKFKDVGESNEEMAKADTAPDPKSKTLGLDGNWQTNCYSVVSKENIFRMGLGQISNNTLSLSVGLYSDSECKNEIPDPYDLSVTGTFSVGEESQTNPGVYNVDVFNSKTNTWKYATWQISETTEHNPHFELTLT